MDGYLRLIRTKTEDSSRIWVSAGPASVEPLCWEYRLGLLGLFNLEKSKLWGDLRAAASA